MASLAFCHPQGHELHVLPCKALHAPQALHSSLALNLFQGLRPCTQALHSSLAFRLRTQALQSSLAHIRFTHTLHSEPGTEAQQSLSGKAQLAMAAWQNPIGNACVAMPTTGNALNRQRLGGGRCVCVCVCGDMLQQRLQLK